MLVLSLRENQEVSIGDELLTIKKVHENYVDILFQEILTRVGEFGIRFPEDIYIEFRRKKGSYAEIGFRAPVPIWRVKCPGEDPKLTE